MTDNELSYKILRHIQQTEQQSPTLTRIQHDFYKQLKAYLQELQDIVSKEQDTKKQALYADELNNTSKIGQHIYELREKKIVQAALSAVRGAVPNLEYLLTEEQTFYQSLVDNITENRTYILNPSNKIIEEEPESEESSSKSEKQMISKNTNPIIHITDDIPCFVGTDMLTYRLRKNDVLSLPQDMAKTLEKRKVATLIK
jgi:DNA replication initiation complex subunit (GINS family)